MAGEPEQDPSGRPSESQGDDGVGWFALVGIGFEFIVAICLGGAIGWWLDRRWNSFPWLMLIGGAIGFAAGLTMIVRAGHSAFKD
jgi:ATP synthase protein I